MAMSVVFEICASLGVTYSAPRTSIGQPASATVQTRAVRANVISRNRLDGFIVVEFGVAGITNLSVLLLTLNLVKDHNKSKWMSYLPLFFGFFHYLLFGFTDDGVLGVMH